MNMKILSRVILKLKVIFILSILLIIGIKSNAFAIFNYSSTTFNGSQNNSDRGYSITVDASSNVYVTGWINGASGGNDIWVGKFNSDLVLQSSVCINGSANTTDEGHGITIDGSGNLYVIGYVQETTGGYNIFISKHFQPSEPDETSPSAISTLTAVTGSNEGEIDLTWTAPGDDGTQGQLQNAKYRVQFSSYIVTWSTMSAQRQIPVSGVNLGDWQYYTLTGLTGETTYYIRVWTGDEALNWSEVSNGATAFTLPPAPTGFSGIAISTTAINWYWTDNSNTETGFRIITDTGGIVGSVLANATFWVETNLSPNTSYYRFVQVHNFAGYSNSESATKYTKANPPTNLTALVITHNTVDLSWSHGEGGAKDYEIQKSTNQTQWQFVADLINWTTRQVTVLNPCTTYWFKISGYNNDGIATDFCDELKVVTEKAPSASITSITPNSGHNMQTIFIENLAGTGFETNAAVKLTKTGKTDINGTNITVVSASMITCYFDLTGSSTGPWTVVVTNPNAQSASLSDGFTIVFPTPEILSITPNTSKNDSSADVTIVGNYFHSGTTTKLTKTDESDITGTNVNITTTSITCIFDLTGKTVGYWNVVVTNSDSQSDTLTDGFFVSEPPPAGSTLQEEKSQDVGTAGGTVEVSDTSSKINNAGVDISSGALRSTLTISISVVINPPPTPSDMNSVGEAVDFGPTGLVFNYQVTIRLPFTQAMLDAAGISDLNSLRIYSYNTTTGAWEEVPGAVPDAANMFVSVNVSHFTLYRIMAAPAAVNLGGVKVYPNPCKIGGGGSFGANVVTFDNLTAKAKIKIYNIVGEIVHEYDENDGDGKYEWNATGIGSNKVAPGVYIYLITNPDNRSDKARSKIAIIR